ncbi:hypothetical protein GIB67_010230, partial [Kingdonia uniflora]
MEYFVSNCSLISVAPALVVGWPPIRSARKNLVSKSLSKPSTQSQSETPLKDNSGNFKSCRKGLFVKINMDELACAVDELFSCLLAAQNNPFGVLDQNSADQVDSIVGLLDGSGDYTLVCEDNEGDRMLAGDVPWNMLACAVKRLRVLKSSDLSTLH